MVDLPHRERRHRRVPVPRRRPPRGRGRHFAVDVSGGLAGLLIDLRDVPLRLPERAERRRELLGAWQTTVAGGPPMGNGWHPGQAAGDPEGPPPVSGSATDLELVPVRHLIESPVDAVFALSPGDRTIVEAGASVVVGAPIAERLRDPTARGQDRHGARGAPSRRPVARARPGRRAGSGSTGRSVHGGEYLFPWKTRWRVATGDIAGPARDAGGRDRARGRDRAPRSRCARPVAASAASSSWVDRRAAGSPSRDPAAGCAPAGSMSAWPARSSSSMRGSMPRP